MFLKQTVRNIEYANGYSYVARTSRPELSSHLRPSTAIILEGNIPLAGPANATHSEIVDVGMGRYSFWHDALYFSTSDNTNPENNGRVYAIQFPITISTVLGIFFPKSAWNLLWKLIWKWAENQQKLYIRAGVFFKFGVDKSRPYYFFIDTWNLLYAVSSGYVYWKERLRRPARKSNG